MPKCPICGTEVAENEKICSACGTDVTSAATAEAAAAAKSAAEKNQFSVENLKNINDTKDSTAEFDAVDIESNKIMSLFAYLGILFLIPMLACPNSKYARYHTNQGIVLFIAGAIVSVATGILTTVLSIIPVIGTVLGVLIGGVCSIVLTVLTILGIINAVQGKAKELPIIGKYKILK